MRCRPRTELPTSNPPSSILNTLFLYRLSCLSRLHLFQHGHTRRCLLSLPSRRLSPSPALAIAATFGPRLTSSARSRTAGTRSRRRPPALISYPFRLSTSSADLTSSSRPRAAMTPAGTSAACSANSFRSPMTDRFQRSNRRQRQLGQHHLRQRGGRSEDSQVAHTRGPLIFLGSTAAAGGGLPRARHHARSYRHPGVSLTSCSLPVLPEPNPETSKIPSTTTTSLGSHPTRMSHHPTSRARTPTSSERRLSITSGRPTFSRLT